VQRVLFEMHKEQTLLGMLKPLPQKQECEHRVAKCAGVRREMPHIWLSKAETSATEYYESSPDALFRRRQKSQARCLFCLSLAVSLSRGMLAFRVRDQT
jgi:hypothetical protein